MLGFNSGGLSMKNILLTGAFQYSDEQKKHIANLGFDVDFHQYEKDIVKHPEKYDAVICNGLFLYNDIRKFMNLKYIQLTSAGYDRVPMDYIKEKGIEIYNARGVYSIPMAEWAVMSALELYKSSRYFFVNQSKKIWQKKRDIKELYKKKIAVIGCGSIGNEVAKRFKAFDCEIIGIDITPPKSEYYDKYIITAQMDTVLSCVDIIVSSVPITDKTYHMLNINSFSKMKDDTILINLSRGSVVDESALIEALKKKKIYGAALDVFEEEPLSMDNELWNFENVIITPHNSFIGDGNVERMFDVIYKNLEEIE